MTPLTPMNLSNVARDDFRECNGENAVEYNEAKVDRVAVASSNGVIGFMENSMLLRRCRPLRELWADKSYLRMRAAALSRRAAEDNNDG